ncbi:MAG: hypothetical protein KAX18_13210 [Candidatus Lokiarchaeota archaeon]|nr:hypothetical protein [Candidatus Lokiarchaeota archaeon]
MVLVSPIALNFVEAISFRDAESLENYRTYYSDGYGELNMELRLEGFAEERYYYSISCRLTSGSGVEIVGIILLNTSVDARGLILKADVFNWDPPHEQYSYDATVRLTKNDVISWSGSAEVQYISNSFTRNETYNYILRIMVPMGSQDYFNLAIISNFVFFSWLLAFPVIPIVLNSIIKPSFGVPFDEEARKKQKKYFDFFRKKQEEQS